MTPSGADVIDLPVGVFMILRDLIGERIGASFDDGHRELLAAKLSARLQTLGLRSFLDYFYVLKYGPGAAEEWDRLTDALSVQETYFWREMDQVRALVDVLLPEYVTSGRDSVRVWSAACATGEEPITIAIALSEAGWFDRAEVVIEASDSSPAALERAVRGVYRERSFRALPPALRDKYFTPIENAWRVDPRLHCRVRYSRANLLDPAETRSLATAPFIFCRNVFIYFSPPTVGRVVGQFAAKMPRPGYLFLGVSESLIRAKTAFELTEVGRAFVYVVRSSEPGAS